MEAGTGMVGTREPGSLGCPDPAQLQRVEEPREAMQDTQGYTAVCWWLWAGIHTFKLSAPPATGTYLVVLVCWRRACSQEGALWPMSLALR